MFKFRIFEYLKSVKAKGWGAFLAEVQVSLFPVFLVFFLAALSYWLAIVAAHEDEDRSGQYRHDPDWYSKKFTVRTFNQNGLKRDVLIGEFAEHFPDDESTMIKNPTLIHSNGLDVPPTNIRANKALINSDQSEVLLMGNVVGKRPAYGDRKSVTFLTSQITVYTDEERAETTHKVKIYEGKSWIAGTGFDADNVTQQYNFHSDVEGSKITEIRNK